MSFVESPVSGSVRVWLRLENLCALLLALCFYRRAHEAGHGSWLLFAVLFLAPDLSMLGFLAGAKVGATAYNLAHNYILPLALAGVATLTDHREALPYALIWIAHIGLDRALGYGLKYSSGFGHTHLGWLGKGNAEQTPAA
jgi:hypothetical protein